MTDKNYGERHPWSPEEDRRLEALWLDGLPTAAIGVAMQRTKSSIIGRAHRLCLPSRPSPILHTASRTIVRRAGKITLEDLASDRAELARRRAERAEQVERDKAAEAQRIAQAAETQRRHQESEQRQAVAEASLFDDAPVSRRTADVTRRGCDMPLWTGRVTHEYCGAPKRFGRPYCDACTESGRLYVPAPVRQPGAVTP